MVIAAEFKVGSGSTSVGLSCILCKLRYALAGEGSRGMSHRKFSLLTLNLEAVLMEIYETIISL